MKIVSKERVIAAQGHDGQWYDPHGGTFTPEEIENLRACAKGEQAIVMIARGTKFQQTHYVHVEGG